MRGDPRCGCPAAVHADRVRAPGGTAIGPNAARHRWLARTTNGASRKVRRIVNRAGKRKPTIWHGAGSGRL
ncbi:hypothetical protein F3J15_38035 [Burkholderia sp. Ap-955]|nr:hypothetical protein [Burkholderia sp. Ap-955]NIG07993.1 hypothetical protein [Burkholderia sp. Tr-849]